MNQVKNFSNGISLNVIKNGQTQQIAALKDRTRYVSFHAQTSTKVKMQSSVKTHQIQIYLKAQFGRFV